ncbi:lysylphosphatidylglycerol synthase domain-containing protein [Sphingomonas sp. CV7422]|uniref:lysylphosphatidylglycerol synthase domain-containing protein n=1 Tax=Sphingomonas sp. CV7422 TaxID=3018036 RepID=UPI0022FDB4E0|nr:lysylphosphatidylglycerol synthase domain-containing protein [Sphingomonas sp. CV7422]
MSWRSLLVAAATLAVLAISVVALRHLLADTQWSAVMTAVRALPTAALAGAAMLAVLSYGILTGFDVVALRLVGRPVPYASVALAAFTSYIFSHNLGFAALTGGAARYRIYRRHGVPLADVGQIMIVAGVTFWLGAVLLLGLSLVLLPSLPPVAHRAISPGFQTAAGLCLLALLAAYMVALGRLGGRAIRLWRWPLRLPTWRMAIVQFALGTGDLLVAASVVFVLLPQPAIMLYPAVLVGYLFAIVTSLLVHAPGGLGVFEVVMIAALPQVDRPGLVAALLAFRLIYYLIPLAIGGLLFVGHELVGLRRPCVDDGVRSFDDHP